MAPHWQFPAVQLISPLIPVVPVERSSVSCPGGIRGDPRITWQVDLRKALNQTGGGLLGAYVLRRVTIKWKRGTHRVSTPAAVWGAPPGTHELVPAAHFHIQVSMDGISWTTVASVQRDVTERVWQSSEGVLLGTGGAPGEGSGQEVLARFLRIVLLKPSQHVTSLVEGGGNGLMYAMDNVAVDGCPLQAATLTAGQNFNLTTASALATTSASDRRLLKAMLGEPSPVDSTSLSLLPTASAPVILPRVATQSFHYEEAQTVLVHSVVPSMGSTAGGTTIVVQGTGFSGVVGETNVTIGGVTCRVTAATFTSVSCLTGRTSILNGGRRQVRVTVVGKGSSLSISNAAGYEYIDRWSVKTTWGGMAPPTGCGSYQSDRACVESVWIPAGQVILLDVSPPRLYLILVEGTLIFARKELHLQATYVLVRGGTVQVQGIRGGAWLEGDVLP